MSRSRKKRRGRSRGDSPQAQERRKRIVHERLYQPWLYQGTLQRNADVGARATAAARERAEEVRIRTEGRAAPPSVAVTPTRIPGLTRSETDIRAGTRRVIREKFDAAHRHIEQERVGL